MHVDEITMAGIGYKLKAALQGIKNLATEGLEEMPVTPTAQRSGFAQSGSGTSGKQASASSDPSLIDLLSLFVRLGVFMFTFSIVHVHCSGLLQAQL